MRIRYKKWARPELEASSFYIDKPEENKGRWKEYFNNENPIHLELGCGKGQFIAQLAVENPNINYIAVDLVDAMLGLAKRNVEQSYEKRNYKDQNGVLVQIVAVDNLYFLIFVWNGAPDIKFRIFFCIVQILLVCLGRKSQGRTLST